MRALGLAVASALTLLVPAVAAAAPPSDDFLQRWRAAEERYQVLDLAAYDAQMSALIPEAVGFDTREHGYFYASAARAACLVGNPAYAGLADTGLQPLDGASGKENDWLATVLRSYSVGSATIVYDQPTRTGVRPAQGWVGTVTSYFGPRNRSGDITQARTIDLQTTDATDEEHRRFRADTEDYGALAVSFCAGLRNQANIVLPDLPFRAAPGTRIDGQAFGLEPDTKVRVTWRPCSHGAVHYLARCEKLGRRKTVRKTLTVTGTSFSFPAPGARGRYLLTVAPIGQKIGRHGRSDGDTIAMVTVKAGKTRLRRQFEPLAAG